jgi:hypothetical protein
MSGTSCNAAPGRLYTAGLPYTPLRPLRVATRSSSSNCANQHTSAQSIPPPPLPFAMSAHNIFIMYATYPLQAMLRRGGAIRRCHVVGWPWQPRTRSCSRWTRSAIDAPCTQFLRHGDPIIARAAAGRGPPGASRSGAPCPHPGRGRCVSLFLTRTGVA